VASGSVRRRTASSGPGDGPHRVHPDDDRADRIQRELVPDIAAAQELPEEATLALREADEEPTDPAAFVSAVHNWTVGEVSSTGDGARFRIIGIEPEIARTLTEHGFSGIFTVERA